MQLTRAKPTELEELYELEVASFPADEAASREGLEQRLTQAGEFFYVYRKEADGPIVGFINGTLSHGDRVTHEAMEGHDSNGSNLCIHGVVVRESCRGQGVGTAMMREYCKQVQQDARLKHISLLAKAAKRAFYERVGFACLGESHVTHGQDTWLDFVLECSGLN
ncbi:MAG: hypothetical protein MHM6MM_004022 [Cercozoa sp. M6MM]